MSYWAREIIADVDTLYHCYLQWPMPSMHPRCHTWRVNIGKHGRWEIRSFPPQVPQRCMVCDRQETADYVAGKQAQIAYKRSHELPHSPEDTP